MMPLLSCARRYAVPNSSGSRPGGAHPRKRDSVGIVTVLPAPSPGMRMGRAFRNVTGILAGAPVHLSPSDLERVCCGVEDE